MQNTRRKTYGGKRYTSRWLLKSFALMLVTAPGPPFPAILCHFARDQSDLACETKTAQRYFDEVEEEIRRETSAASLHGATGHDTQAGQNSPKTGDFLFRTGTCRNTAGSRPSRDGVHAVECAHVPHGAQWRRMRAT